MKKVLAIVLSLVLALSLVAFVACDNTPGGNNFHEVDLEDQDTREEFVNALAEKVDVEKLIGDPTEEGWTFGLEETAKSKLDFDVQYSMAGTSIGAYTAKGKVEFSENAKLKITGNSANDAPDFVSSTSIGLKGNVELSDSIYALLNVLSQQIDVDGLDIAATVKSVITNFNYEVKTYVDKDVALVEMSDGLYSKLPDFVREFLGSRKLKFDLSDLTSYGISTFETTTTEGVEDFLELDTEEVKQFINDFIDDVLLQYKISISVSATNGYALRITVKQESILAILDEVFNDVPANYAELVSSLKNAIGSDTKFELTVRVDEEGAFSSIKTESRFSINLSLSTSALGTVKAKISTSDTVEIKKFSGRISKPNDKDYEELDVSGLIGSGDYGFGW